MRHTGDLIAFTLRSHWRSVAIWAVGLGAVQWIFALTWVAELERYPGGAAAFGAGVGAAAEAMRVIRWPAERLDTLGGYISYHDLTMFPLFIGLYAAVQGAQAIRGIEERGVLETWLATGHRPIAIFIERAAAFLIALVVIGLGIGAGTAIGMNAAGQPATVASFVTTQIMVLVAAVFYALALLVSQAVRTARGAAAVTSVVMVGLYLLANVADLLGPWSALEHLSPFYYRHLSDMLIPGIGFDAGATAVLVAAVAGCLALAATAFTRRDLGGTLVTVRPTPARASRAVRPSLAARSMWTHALSRQRLGLTAWAVAGGVFLAVFASIGPSVVEIWEKIPLLRSILLSGREGTLADQYVAFAVSTVALLVAAFGVTEAARWAGDAAEGRVEMTLAQPVARYRIPVERAVSAGVGTAVVITGAIAGLVVGSAAVSLPLGAAGLWTAAWALELFGLAVAGVATLLVCTFRVMTTAALGVWLATSYLVTTFSRLFEWPEWTLRTSVFEALGVPYLEMPPAWGLALLTGMALAGVAAAGIITERRASAVV